MNDDSILGSTLGQLGGVIKQTGKQVVSSAKDIVEGVGEQVSVKTEPYSQNDKTSSKIPKVTTGEVVDGFYSKSTDNSKNAVVTASTGDSESKKQISDKSKEEQKKLEIRQKLFEERHKETYYDPIFNPPKKTEEQEERPAEKVENEKKQEMQELEQKKAERPPPLVQRARERVERFPGATG